MELQQFGPYRIEALLGRGGMGEVYRAFDTEHDRTVALKVLSEHLAADTGYRERFRREAHLAARLNEPHIVPIHRYGEVEGRLFLDMRLVPGRDVAAVLAEEGPMSPERAVSVVGQIARALDAAHADGLVHRDVKPSNVLLTGTGDDEFVYLVDFGIARSTSDAQGPALTQTGAALGSFDYMAPERFLERPIDRRVDVYALACVLFECLTARRPFTGDGLATLMYAHLNTTPPPPSALRPGLPRALDDVVARGLAKEPGERYASCGELAAAARAALASVGVAARPEAAPPTAVTPLPVRPQTVGFGATGYGPPSSPGVPAAGYGPPSSPGLPTAFGPPSNPGPPVGYGPPSNPGPSVGYGPPSNPGPSAGYGPPPGPGFPPAGPGFPSPGGASPSGQRRSTRLPVVLAGLAAVVVLAVVAVVALAGRSGDTTTDTPQAGGSSGQAGTSSGAGATTDPEPDPEEQLRAVLPAGFDAASCTTQGAAGDGDLAALQCGAARQQPGPQVAFFYLYEDGAAVDAVFVSDVTGVGLSPLGSTDCPDAQGYRGYDGPDGELAGRVACWVDDEGDANLAWTQDDVAAEGHVVVAGGGEAGLADLWTWWNDADQSDFRAG
ncbi:serine/threonine-protein kinase [Geodermatophilus tzadiensis]|uniref:non-specific serine/threonine protein kinase n=1 Tax=Geodermatophilus tzadiensis TaxID=1137988 RepID=A0A2T0T8W4_9ACTN|nr:serine/threonine-protein kinase [Geodermatophilus tzadiensis]PRY42078.1 serine/threonine-protein kinase [Geodermatophilus tzadiensis]